MVNLDHLLARPGLRPGERLLMLLKACLWPGDTEFARLVIQRARQIGVPRVELEEVLLQATLFYGFPRAVSAFEVLSEVWPVDRNPRGGGLPEADREAAGRKLFAAVYGRNEEPVRRMLQSFHEDFYEFVVTAAYGRILSRPGLSSRVRELLAVGALVIMDQWPQLVAHARGASNFGATETELRETVFTATLDEARAREVVQRLLKA